MRKLYAFDGKWGRTFKVASGLTCDEMRKQVRESVLVFAKERKSTVWTVQPIDGDSLSVEIGKDGGPRYTDYHRVTFTRKEIGAPTERKVVRTIDATEPNAARNIKGPVNVRYKDVQGKSLVVRALPAHSGYAGVGEYSHRISSAPRR